MARRHHTGSGRRRVIPADWQTHHAAVIGEAVTDVACTVSIGPADGGAPSYDATNGYSAGAAAAAVYTGPAAVMALSNTDRRMVVADDDVSTQAYRVTLDVDVTGVTTAHVVKVLTSDDPALTGRTLSVAAVDRGSRRFSRVLLATLND